MQLDQQLLDAVCGMGEWNWVGMNEVSIVDTSYESDIPSPHESESGNLDDMEQGDPDPIPELPAETTATSPLEQDTACAAAADKGEHSVDNATVREEATT
jgi:hypothetical protein